MVTDAQVKACCAAAYSSDLVALLLGEAYHPGGLALTRRLADQLALRPGASVLDVASGPGTTARLLAAEYGAVVTGVDLSAAGLARAAAQAVPGVRFLAGDAQRLPFSDASVDAVVCECALCTFSDKPAAVAEFARVLRPGGRVGITDVTAQPERLPAPLSGLAAQVACIADARPTADYAALLAGAGLRVRVTEPHGAALSRMVDQIEARLKLLALTAPARLADLGLDLAPGSGLGLDLGQAGEVLAAARQAIAAGHLGYTLLVAQAPPR